MLISVIFDIKVARNVRDLELLDSPINVSKRYTSSNQSSTAVSRTTSTTFTEDNIRSTVLLRSFRRIRPAGSGDIATSEDKADSGSMSESVKEKEKRMKKQSSSYDSYIASFGRASLRNMKNIVDPSTRETYHLQQHHIFDPNIASLKKDKRPPLRHLSYDKPELNKKNKGFESPTIKRQSPVDDHLDQEIFDITVAETEPNHSITGFKITGV